ncbi:hypothetical protein [Nocardioides ganghwensis]|uniref:Lipoprotein n=1 Tax=Nocardioides ganghwensis TaxID=252230 RepID=A0A4Q2S669_9ACTN|nr:hypothetical protein [Nocardioides ganghwensis]MBD3947880.1 hypothetical protein [Nocardioides ganghwensis]RYB97699.1 hypothetical protein EUA07_19460 [Nocardioides ganghwensis]
MSDRRTTRARRQRRPWSIFGAVSAAVLGACVVATVRSSGAADAGVVLLGGLIVTGIAAALVSSVVSPPPDGAGTGRAMTGGFEGGSVGDLSGGGGGDC